MSLINNQENNLVGNNLPFSTSLETKSDHIIEVATQQPRDIYKAVSDHPYSPVAWGLGTSMVIVATGGVIKVWKSSPEELKYLGDCISTVIHAVADFAQVLKGSNKEDHQEDKKVNQDRDNQ
ncbi:hypothetical protein [Sphaerospermopsis torques-reginae]|uniref:Uncharacterized protein n=1 Tax=Sphaerospermopsis torques-reginae ITEP-024 TaxID=984208 RepID=A0ABX8WUV0_9CYAN|nr:hypothetical protein [Sphaerospermopsis torques-reginae]QYX30195.1 hypothetical protein K2F26_14735 [Sphaerospermopsis torques-reginae ITEP-024]